jgi:hypothetical protein
VIQAHDGLLETVTDDDAADAFLSPFVWPPATVKKQNNFQY